MSSSSKLQRTVRASGGGTVIRLEGSIDADLKDVGMLQDASGHVVLDMDGVKRITSFGVREWINEVSKMAPGHLFYVKCRPSLVSQFNMVARFAGPGEIVSMYLPYLCGACDTEFETLLDLRTDHAVTRADEAPTTPCPSCGEPAELDDSPQSYFSYVASRPPPIVPDVVRAILDGGSESGAKEDRLVVQKEVAGSITGVWLSGPLNARARFKRAGDGLEGDVVLLCAGIDRLDPAGAEKLSAFLGLPGRGESEATIWVARARPALLTALDKSTLAAMQKRVVDLLVHADCPSCGSSGELLADLAYANAAGPMQPRPCFRCGTTATPRLTDAQRNSLKLLLGEAPPAVRAYLSTRPGTKLPESVDEEASTRFAAAQGPGSDPMIAGLSNAVGKYEVISRIGHGGMAEVVLARQRGPEGFAKKVVLKRILPAYAASGDFVRMFLQEARVAARIDHPHVVQIFDLGRDGPHYFIAMEYVRGWDLKTVVASAAQLGQKLPIPLAMRVVADVCAGLHAAHTSVDDEGRPAPIVHRDVSPHNVLVSVEGAVKITDFGISKAMDASIGTRPGTLKGKVTYMAPEQVDESLGQVDVRSDVFAAGIILHELLTGVPLFRRDSEYASLMAVLTAPVPSVRTASPDVPKQLDDIVMKALQRAPDARYATAQELHLALEATLLAMGAPSTASHLATWLATLAPKPAGDATSTGTTPTGATQEVLDIEDGDGFREDTIVAPRAENE